MTYIIKRLRVKCTDVCKLFEVHEKHGFLLISGLRYGEIRDTASTAAAN